MFMTPEFQEFPNIAYINSHLLNALLKTKNVFIDRIYKSIVFFTPQGQMFLHNLGCVLFLLS